MRALTYTNTKSDGLNYVGGILHKEKPRGYAYETSTHFVHMFGDEKHQWGVWPGMTVTQKRDGSLESWVDRTFGAENFSYCDLEVGQTVSKIWRPGIFQYDAIRQGLATTDEERHAALRSTELLLNRLDDLLLYI